MRKIIFLLLIFPTLLLPDLLKPENGEYVRSIHILFEWEQEVDAVSYNLQVANQSSFIDVSLIIDTEELTTVLIDTENFDWDDTYYWKVRPIYNDGSYGQYSETSSFTTGETILTNVNVDVEDYDLVSDGVMVYSQFLPYFAVGAIDKWGNEIWNTQIAYMNHINEFGQMYGVSQEAGVRFNFKHDFLWTTPQGYNIDGHEVKQITNGNYMAFQRITQPGPISPGNWSFLFQGYEIDGVTNEYPWLGLKIVEFDKETGQEVWSWNPFEHFSMDDHDLYEGTWWNAAFEGFYDWMHSNAFHFDEEESVIYVSHRHLSRISKITYPSGDVIWNMGLPEEYNTGNDNICTDLLFSFQHHIQLMDDGSLLFFDNGNLSDMLMGDSNPTTRIRKINVIDDSYCETVWQYDLPQNLFGLGMGSVQLLENGNYSIYTYGSGLDNGECSILEITQDGDILWKATSQNQNAAWYRSYKIPSIYPDAFSVVANQFVLDDTNAIEVNNGEISFTIYNKSGYTQNYQYMFSDLTDGGSPLFIYDEGEIIINPNENLDLLFEVENEEVSSSIVSLSIWPTYHEYSLKELSFNVVNNNFLIGDVNYDGQVNVVDVVVVVGIVLGTQELVPNADINQDQSINVLDIVALVNIILGT